MSVAGTIAFAVQSNAGGPTTTQAQPDSNTQVDEAPGIGDASSSPRAGRANSPVDPQRDSGGAGLVPTHAATPRAVQATPRTLSAPSVAKSQDTAQPTSQPSSSAPAQAAPKPASSPSSQSSAPQAGRPPSTAPESDSGGDSGGSSPSGGVVDGVVDGVGGAVGSLTDSVGGLLGG